MLCCNCTFELATLCCETGALIPCAHSLLAGTLPSLGGKVFPFDLFRVGAGLPQKFFAAIIDLGTTDR